MDVWLFLPIFSFPEKLVQNLVTFFPLSLKLCDQVILMWFILADVLSSAFMSRDWVDLSASMFC